MKIETIIVKSEIRKLRTKQYIERFDLEKDDIVIENVTGLSDEELHKKMMNNPTYRKTFEDYIYKEKMKDREKKIKRILND